MGDGVDIITDADGEDVVSFQNAISSTQVKAFHATSSKGEYLFVIQYGANDAVGILGGNENSIKRFDFSDISLTGRELIKLASGEPIDRKLSEPGIAQGGRFDDTLIGSFGDDELYGEEGDDILAGAAGNDLLYGGAGNDSYRLGVGTGQDIVFEQADDASVLKLFNGLKLTEIDYKRQGKDLLIGLSKSLDNIRINDFFLNNQVWRIETDQGDVQVVDIQSMANVRTINAASGSVSSLREQYFKQVRNFYQSLLSAFAYTLENDGTLAKEVSPSGFTSDIRQYRVSTQVTDVRDMSLLSNIANKEEVVIDTGRTETRNFYATTSVNGTFVAAEAVKSQQPKYVYYGEDSSDAELEGYYQHSPVVGPVKSVDPLTGEQIYDIEGYWLTPNNSIPSIEVTEISRHQIPIIQHDVTYNILNIAAGDEADIVNLASHFFYAVEGGAGNDRLSAIHDRFGGLVDQGSSISRYDEYAVKERNKIILPEGNSVNNSSAPGVFLYGAEGDDTLFGGDRDDVLIGGAGFDRMEGGLGHDRYVLGAGDGKDIVYDDGWIATNTAQRDIVVLPENITLSDIDVSWGTHIQNSFYMGDGFEEKLNMLHTSLELTWGNEQGVSIVLPHSDQRAGYGVDYIQFSDGAITPIDQLMALAGNNSGVDPHDNDNSLQADNTLYGGSGNDHLTIDTGDFINDPEESQRGERGSEGEITLLNPADIEYLGKLVGGEGHDELIGSNNNDEIIGGEIFVDYSLDFRRTPGAYWSSGDTFNGGRGGRSVVDDGGQ